MVASPASPGRGPARLAWPALALWVALELLVLRGCLRTALGLARGWGLEATTWDLAQDLAMALAGSLGAALVATLPRAGAHGARRAFLLAIAAATVVWALAGGLERPHARLWTPANATPLGLVGLAVIALAVALDLDRRAARPRPGLAPFGGLRGIALPTAVGFVLVSGFAALRILDPPERTARELVRELFADPSRWNVTAKHSSPDAAPRTAMLAPVFRSEAARPAIVMAPPCEIRWAIGAEDAHSRLFGLAGADVRLGRALRESPVRVRFQALVGDEPVFDHTASIGTGELAWQPLAEGGIPLDEGDVVTLRTSALDPWPDGLAPRDLLLGFGQLQLVRARPAALEPATQARPNVVLIVQDTQRADRLGCYGNERGLTPNLDRLSARGLTWEEAFSTSSWTWPATASLLTGLLPEEHGVTSNESCYLWGSERTLAEVLSERGWATAAFTANPLIVAPQNFDQGFDDFDAAARFRKSPELLPSVLDWLDTHAPERFFLYLHLVDPHEPHRPDPDLAERLGLTRPPDLPPGVEPEEAYNVWTKALLDPAHYDGDGELLAQWALSDAQRDFVLDSYDAAVASGDRAIGRVLDEIAGLGLEGRTLVVFTSDHGEELLDHGRLAHGHALGRELVRVPLIVAGPDVPAGTRSSVPVSNRDVFATLARLAGEPARRGVDLCDPAAPSAGPPFFSTEKGWWNGRSGQRLYGLRSTRHTLHWAPTGASWGAEPGPDGQVRLFAAEDSRELHDLSAERVEERNALLAELRGILRESQYRRATGGLGASDALQADLRRIGYFDDAPKEPR